MSAKWRALQHRHRYTYNAVVFPQSYTNPLHQLPPKIQSLPFYTQLISFVALNSTYAQLNQSKKLASLFSELLSSNPDENLVREASRFYLEIMFLENSVPLHKTLVSALTKTRNFKLVVCDCLKVLCDEYGEINGKGKRFCVSRVALSMMSSPKLGFLSEVVENCAILAALNVVFSLRSVVSETRDGSRPSPVVMEQCQEGLSCVYYLLQRFSRKFNDINVMEMILETIVSVLKSSAFTRDCYVAAGVSLCAALQICLNPEELSLIIVEGVFFKLNCCIIDGSGYEIKDVVSKVPFKGDLFSDIRNFSALSRLCLIRGVLTAVSRTELNFRFKINDSISTILYDEILPELCRYCENPTDSHFNFHALTVMQICLQQIKTLIQSNSDNPEKYFNEISEDMGSRILSIIWNNLEDPLSQTVKQVHLIFNLFLDIQSTSFHWVNGNESVKLLLQPIASDLLCLGPRCKGRYIPLASITKRLGAKFILNMCPNLVYETAHAYNDDDVCCAATTFLKCLLESLRDEYWNSDGIENGYLKYRDICLPPFLFGLGSGVSKLRTNLNTYALPVLLELDVDSIFIMLSYISVWQCEEEREEERESDYHEFGSKNMPLGVEQKVAILVSLLKVSRSLALIEGDIDWFENSFSGENIRISESNCYAVFRVKGINVKVQAAWLVMALTHVDESLRVDAGECLFLNPKTSSLPSNLELSVLKEAVPLNMRCCSTGFQMKWNSLFRKFFSRVKTALEKQIKQGSWQPHQVTETAEFSDNRAENLFKFMKWLSSFLFFSCYPSAPYERKMMAMEMILTMLNVWSIVHTPCSENNFSFYNKAFTSPDSTLLLVGSVVDSWDRLRENSFRILLHFPTPLPGICNEEIVQNFIIWAKKLVCSPRVRESDAGALSFRLIFRIYALELGWSVRPSCNLVSSHSRNCISSSSSMVYINSLIDWLKALVEEGEKDLYEACKKSFVHGALLTLRYTFEEIDWNRDIDTSIYSEMRLILEKLLELIMRITSLALCVVSADAWHLTEDIDDMVDEEICLSEVVPADVDISEPLSGNEIKNEKNARDFNPSSDQVVMVGSWLAMKEVSLLLGTIIRKIPLPTSDLLLENGEANTVIAPFMTSDVVLDLKQLENIGNHFLEVLLKMKHNGAIDKTRAGFSALCNRLLCSNDPSLCKLTESWMEQLMERTAAKGQTVDDLLRRSAGIPAAFTALFLSEPEGTPKKLLPKALRWLIDTANISLNNISSNSQNLVQEMDVNERASKIRDEGVVPTVHSFNVLRAAFNDTNLATDTSGFCAEALIIAIRSFSSPYWEIRNSACQAYTALVRRMIGFLNVQKRESARRALTGLEFFHRYPSLHQFLLNELRVATELLQDSNLAKIVHPSLCPILILLSRLKPSTISSESGDTLDPFLFMPFIRKCCVQSNYKVRVLASRALTGLVSNEKLPSVLLNIASELPLEKNNRISFNSIHGMLLQLSSLLEINCQNLVDVAKKDQIIGDLFRVFVTCSWMGLPKLCPCPSVINCCLKVLNNMLDNASKNIAHIRKLIWELSSECLEIETSQRLFYDPTLVELRKQAAISYFSCVLPVSKNGSEDGSMLLQNCPPTATEFSAVPEIENSLFNFQKILVRSMLDASYEVRVATLKWLLFYIINKNSGEGVTDLFKNGSSILGWIRTDIQNVLTNCLAVEKNHKCTLYILRILFTWNFLQFKKQKGEPCEEIKYLGNMDYDSVLQFWNKLVSMCNQTRHAKTRVTLICCIGICVKKISNLLGTYFLSESATNKIDENGKLIMYDCIAFYVDLIKKHSDASEPVNMRRAAAESLVSSGLLEQAEVIGPFVINSRIQSEELKFVNTYARKILDTWFICIRLLEDEDDELRIRIALDVQKCFSYSLFAASVPSQVEKVIELSFEHLSSIFGNWLEYLNYISNWVFDEANCVVSVGDHIRRVFDKEIDNHHEEKLLICQICCSHLEKLCATKSLVVGNSDKIGIRDFLVGWREKFRLQLISFANDYISKQGEVDWIASVGNNKDAFLPIYSNLLGLYSLSKGLFQSSDFEDCKSLFADVVELEEIICSFLRNPMISNLYMLIIELHENIAGISSHLTMKAREESSWDGFNPYFLL